jgi:hypothetical protein
MGGRWSFPNVAFHGAFIKRPRFSKTLIETENSVILFLHIPMCEIKPLAKMFGTNLAQMAQVGKKNPPASMVCGWGFEGYAEGEKQKSKKHLKPRNCRR